MYKRAGNAFLVGGLMGMGMGGAETAQMIAAYNIEAKKSRAEFSKILGVEPNALPEKYRSMESREKALEDYRLHGTPIVAGEATEADVQEWALRRIGEVLWEEEMAKMTNDKDALARTNETNIEELIAKTGMSLEEIQAAFYGNDASDASAEAQAAEAEDENIIETSVMGTENVMPPEQAQPETEPIPEQVQEPIPEQVLVEETPIPSEEQTPVEQQTPEEPMPESVPEEPPAAEEVKQEKEAKPEEPPKKEEPPAEPPKPKKNNGIKVAKPKGKAADDTKTETPEDVKPPAKAEEAKPTQFSDELRKDIETSRKRDGQIAKWVERIRLNRGRNWHWLMRKQKAINALQPNAVRMLMNCGAKRSRRSPWHKSKEAGYEERNQDRNCHGKECAGIKLAIKSENSNSRGQREKSRTLPQCSKEN